MGFNCPENLAHPCILTFFLHIYDGIWKYRGFWSLEKCSRMSIFEVPDSEGRKMIFDYVPDSGA